MAALYADEHVPLQVVEMLRQLGHDVLTISDDGNANRGMSDAAILARAAHLARAVVTNNRRHFHGLHRTRPKHEGIITYTEDPDRVALAGRIHSAIDTLDSLAGRLVRVVRPNPPPAPKPISRQP